MYLYDRLWIVTLRIYSICILLPRGTCFQSANKLDNDHVMCLQTTNKVPNNVDNVCMHNVFALVLQVICDLRAINLEATLVLLHLTRVLLTREDNASYSRHFAFRPPLI